MLWLLLRLNSRDGTDESSLGWPLSLCGEALLLLRLREDDCDTTTTSSRYPRGWRGGVGGSFDEVFLGLLVGDDDDAVAAAVVALIPVHRRIRLRVRRAGMTTIFPSSLDRGLYSF